MNIPTHTLDKIFIGLISITLLYIFYPKNNNIIQEELIVDNSDYENFPLIAWFDMEEKWDKSIGNVVKIKYRVFTNNTRIWVYDEYGRVVHKQPYDRNPRDDGTPRDFTYSWRLYKSEYSNEIEPGNYIISIGYATKNTGGKRKISITI